MSTTTTHTFNRDNWTGETTTITVETADDGTTSFEMDGYRYALGPEVSTGTDRFDAVTREVTLDGEPFAAVFRFNDEDRWTATAVGVGRASDIPEIAVARLASMVV